MGTEDGEIDLVKLNFSEAVHAMYSDTYACRENLTEVVMHYLTVDRKARILDREHVLVLRLSIYKKKLAIQYADKIRIYESIMDEKAEPHLLQRERIRAVIPCDNMLLLSSHLLFSLDKTLTLYAFSGKKVRTWRMDTTIRYMKVDGGMEGREGVLVTLDSGLILKVFIDNPFPVEIGKRDAPVICVDLSLRRDKLATVDTNKMLIVTRIKTQEALLVYRGAIAVCFNTEVDDMLCYTGESSIFVVSGIGLGSGMSDGNEVPQAADPLEQHVAGLAIGFHGQRVHCLYKGSIISLDIPQGSNMLRLLDRGDVKGAYSIACLGATESDWRTLAMRSLRSSYLDVAKKSFARLKDSKFLNLIESIEKSLQAGTGSGKQSSNNSSYRGALDVRWQAEIMAYEGQHDEAAKLYNKNGKLEEAIRLLVDLRRWNDAKQFSQNASVSNSSAATIAGFDPSSLTVQQAKWLQEVNDWKGSAEILISLGQYMDAVKAVVEHREKGRDDESGWQNIVIEIVRAVPKDQIDVLHYCGELLTEADEDALARETYAKLGDVSKLMALYVKKQMFAEAAKLAEENEGKFDCSVFLPYAEWLVLQDEYEEAIAMFKKAGRNDLGRRVLEELTFNAVVESRFKDASYFYFLLSKEADPGDDAAKIEYEKKADVYYAYYSVHTFVTDPFTTHLPETLFQVSRFLINTLSTMSSVPYGISKASTLYTLAKQSLHLGAYKLARQTYDKLNQLQPPARRQEEIERDMLVVQAKPVGDEAEVLPVCYRCGFTNPLLNPGVAKFAKGDVCTNCAHPFVRSFVTFEPLPLVEFALDPPSLSDEEAIELIRSSPNGSGGGKKGKGSGKGGGAGPGGWKESKIGESDMMMLDGGGGGDDSFYDNNSSFAAMNNSFGEDGSDLFSQRLNIAVEHMVSVSVYSFYTKLRGGPTFFLAFTS